MKHILQFFALTVCILITSCSGDDTPKELAQVKHMTFLYAVNDNNLKSDLVRNEAQILKALKALPDGEYSFIIYKSENAESAGLFKAISGPNAEWTKIRNYDRAVNATSPERLRCAIADALEIDNVDHRLLFLWGHGSAWYSQSTNTPQQKTIAPIEHTPDLYAFGGDNNQRDWIDIDELASAIPDHVFDTIWFDSCYMANIETAYQLRNKCASMICYPIEIHANGLPYHIVLPYILTDTPDYYTAADKLYDYYASDWPIAVTIMKMGEIEKVATACNRIYRSGSNLPQYFGLLNYSIRSYDCYDLRQYWREYAEANDAEALREDLDKALADFIPYTKSTEYNWSGRRIPAENYSGVSTHLYENNSDSQNEFYRSLDWYNAVIN